VQLQRRGNLRQSQRRVALSKQVEHGKSPVQSLNFVRALRLPLSLSYDHRVIDGAEAARFVVFLSRTLGDVKALL
jgi:pyruvate/2-oxoglutarate dehydrogenase complex dihydrolipoamide acyltransferase (E2) component